MDELTRNATGTTPRRGFFRRIAGAMALGLAGFALDPSRVQGAAARPGGPDWPGPLKGRHRQLVDAYEINKGAPLAFAHTFLATSEPSTANVVAATAVVVLRHDAFPLALGDAMWRKYKIGEAFKIDDPETKAPALEESVPASEGGRAASGRHGDRPAARQRHRVRRLPRRVAVPEQDARRQRRRERGGRGERVDRKRDPRNHDPPFGGMGREPRTGGGLHLLRRRLSGAPPAASHRRRMRARSTGLQSRFCRAGLRPGAASTPPQETYVEPRR